MFRTYLLGLAPILWDLKRTLLGRVLSRPISHLLYLLPAWVSCEHQGVCMSVASLVTQTRNKKAAQALSFGSENQASILVLDGRSRAIVIAESLARIIVAIRIPSVCWRSFRPPNHRDLSSQTLRSLCCDSNRAIGVLSFSIRSTWDCGMACESWSRSLHASNWAILPI